MRPRNPLLRLRAWLLLRLAGKSQVAINLTIPGEAADGTRAFLVVKGYDVIANCSFDMGPLKELRPRA